MKRKSRTIIYKILLAACALLLIIPPAKPSPQIDMRALVVALGIDSSPRGVRCCAQIVLPSQPGESSGQYETVSGEGESLSVALDEIGMSLGRTLDCNHCALIVLGKEKAESGVGEEMAYLVTGGQVSPEINVIVSDNKDAHEFITLLNAYSKKLDVSNLIGHNEEGIYNPSTGILNFMSDIHSQSRSAVVPVYKMAPPSQAKDSGGSSGESSGGSSSESSSSGGGSSGGSSSGSGGSSGSSSGSGESSSGGKSGDSSEEQSLISQSKKTALFFEDKICGYLDETATGGLSWLDKNSSTGVFLIRDLQIGDRRIDKLSCMLRKKKVSVKAEYREKTPVLKIKFDLLFKIEERQALSSIRFNSSDETVKRISPVLQQKISGHIVSQIEEVLRQSRQYGCDALKIGDRFYKTHNKRYEAEKENTDYSKESELAFEFDIIVE